MQIMSHFYICYQNFNTIQETVCKLSCLFSSFKQTGNLKRVYNSYEIYPMGFIQSETLSLNYRTWIGFKIM